VVNGETGLIVPKRDVEGTAGAIQYFLDHPEERERMGRAGRRRAEELYDWRENVGRMVSIYENVLEGSGNRQEN
jgi:glycosyltransferase